MHSEEYSAGLCFQKKKQKQKQIKNKERQFQKKKEKHDAWDIRSKTSGRKCKENGT